MLGSAFMEIYVNVPLLEILLFTVYGDNYRHSLFILLDLN